MPPSNNPPAAGPAPVVPALVAKALLEGRVVFYGEFRRGLAVEFSGKAGKVFHQSKMTVETETGTITVVEFLADSVDWQNWKPPFQKGQMVFGICRGVEESSGVIVASAKLHSAGV